MDQEQTYKWTKDRLRELQAGTLTEQDKSRLRAIAREDPFVADALEGYNTYPDPLHAQNLALISTKISPIVRQRRRWLIPNMTITAIAASLILLIGAWAVINRMTQKTDDSFLVFIVPDSLLTDGIVKEDLAIASEQPASHLEKESDQQAVAVTPADDGFENNNTRRERVHTQDAKAAISASKTTTPTTSGNSKPSLPPVAKESEAGNLAEADAVQEQIAAEKKDAGYYANQMDPSVMSKRVSGYVTDELGQPLIGANLQIRNTNLGTTSDLGGKFELFLPAPESVIDVSYTGYASSNVTLKQGEEQVQIKLPESASLLDAVVVGTSTRSQAKNSKSSGTSSQNVADPFVDYLKANSKYPLLENLNANGKEVIVEFTVTAAGKPDKVKVASSSQRKSFDDEAIRLIKNGPEWICADDVYPCLVRYVIYFK